MKQDIIIVGGGPAGISAGIYALRANKKICIIEKEIIGGKISSASLVENYPGVLEIKGIELAEKLKEQLLQLGGVIVNKEVIAIKQEKNKKIVTTGENEYKSDVVILAMGTKYKVLGLPEEEKWIGKGISFCATCDGFFYKNKTVAVIGGGNTAISNAIELAEVCKKVYVVQVLDFLTAEPILIQRLKEKENIEIKYQTFVKEYIGENKIKAVRIQEKEEEGILEVDGVFLAVGQIPETKLVESFLEMNEDGYIIVKEDLQTSQEGIFAIGDCIQKKVRQLTTAVNDGTIAALAAIEYLNKKNL